MACRRSAASFCRLPVAAQVHRLPLYGFLERRWPQQFARIERTEITGPARTTVARGACGLRGSCARGPRLPNDQPGATRQRHRSPNGKKNLRRLYPKRKAKNRAFRALEVESESVKDTLSRFF